MDGRDAREGDLYRILYPETIESMNIGLSRAMMDRLGSLFRVFGRACGEPQKASFFCLRVDGLLRDGRAGVTRGGHAGSLVRRQPYREDRAQVVRAIRADDRQVATRLPCAILKPRRQGFGRDERCMDAGVKSRPYRFPLCK